jgi:DNA replication and repair protein RecF
VFLRHLSLVNFKNYEQADIEFVPGVNCLIGDNGSGKTNVLDAVHYLSICKSYFNPIDSQNIRHNEKFMVIQGQFEKDGETDEVYCGLKQSQKKIFRRNGKDYQRLADHIGHYPCVIITPNDVDLIKEGSEYRRKFVDSIISQYNRRYLDDLIDYKQVVSQRNNLLKYFAAERTFDADNLAIWNEKLKELALRIQNERHKFVAEFSELFEGYYAKISGESERATVRYSTNFAPDTIDDLLVKSLQKERMLQYTTIGAHKDDFEFLLDEFPLKKFGSQGQQKSFLIALKLAQFKFVKSARGVTPILLLDDVFDKIDDKRVGYLMELVSENEFGQIFITDTNHGRVTDLFRNIDVELKVFPVSSGQINTEILN